MLLTATDEAVIDCELNRDSNPFTFGIISTDFDIIKVDINSSW